jgi:hypothetical protein
MEHHTKLLQFRAPESLSEAIDAAAKRELQTKSEYVRRSVIDRLRAGSALGSYAHFVASPKGQEQKA